MSAGELLIALLALIVLIIIALLVIPPLLLTGGALYGIGQWISDKIKGVPPEERVRRTLGYSPREQAARRAKQARLRALVDNPDETPEDRRRKKEEGARVEERRRYLDSLVDR